MGVNQLCMKSFSGTPPSRVGVFKSVESSPKIKLLWIAQWAE